MLRRKQFSKLNLVPYSANFIQVQNIQSIQCPAKFALLSELVKDEQLTVDTAYKLGQSLAADKACHGALVSRLPYSIPLPPSPFPPTPPPPPPPLSSDQAPQRRQFTQFGAASPAGINGEQR